MEKKIIRLKEVDSTNAFLKNLDTYDEDALTIAVADFSGKSDAEALCVFGGVRQKSAEEAQHVSALDDPS